MSCCHENDCFEFMLRALSALHLTEAGWNNLNFSITVEVEVAK